MNHVILSCASKYFTWQWGATGHGYFIARRGGFDCSLTQDTADNITTNTDTYVTCMRKEVPVGPLEVASIQCNQNQKLTSS